MRLPARASRAVTESFFPEVGLPVYSFKSSVILAELSYPTAHSANQSCLRKAGDIQAPFFLPFHPDAFTTLIPLSRHG